MLCFAAVLPLAMTAACGQKGPLYLPPRNGTVVTRPAGSGPAAAPAPAPAPGSTTPSSTPPQTTNQSTQDTTTSPSTPGESGKKKDDSQTPPK
jgi:predicted small lipoprotein YifL